MTVQMNLAFCQVNSEVKKMQLPSFEQVSSSPEVADLGVAVTLDSLTSRVGEPIILHGSYRIDKDLIQKTHDEPLTWVLVMIVRRDLPMAWVKPVRTKPNIAPLPMQKEEPIGESVRRGGYFNLDLRSHVGLPDEPADYWLMVSMGNYITERVSFRVR